MMSDILIAVGIGIAVPVILLLGPYVPLMLMPSFWSPWGRGGGGKEAVRQAEQFAQNYWDGFLMGLEGKPHASTNDGSQGNRKEDA